MFFTHVIVVLLVVAESTSQKVQSNVSLTHNISAKKLYLIEGNSVTINASLTYLHLNRSLTNGTLNISCWTDYPKVATISNFTEKYLPNDVFDTGFVNIEVTVSAKRIGGSNLFCTINDENYKEMPVNAHKVAILIVKRVSTMDEFIFRIGLISLIVFITFVMGCELDPAIIFLYLKRPISPFIGFVCQFVVMPISAFGLAKLTNIDNAFGFGLLTIGCSPGGGASNIWTVLFGGDLNLSMTMTFISSCTALFMMPFWMFVLGRFFIDPMTLSIPYGQIGLDLLQVVIPVAFGMLFRWKFKKQAIILRKKVKIMGLIYLIYVLSYGSYANLYLFRLMGDYPYLLPIGACLPWLGFLFGYILGLICRQTKAQVIAITVETGIQNIGIALLILKFSMPQPTGDLGAVMPLIVALFTPFPLYIAITALTIKKKCFGVKKELEEQKSSPITTDQKDQLLDDQDRG